jgi:hypothetical protein
MIVTMLGSSRSPWRHAAATLACTLAMLCAPAAPAWERSARAPAGALSCETLDTVPIHPNVDWATQVFPKLSSCSSCHLVEFPGSQLRITPGDPDLTLLNLLDPSNGLVAPTAPRAGNLFLRLNCGDAGDVGYRMPRCLTPPCNYWTPADQALLYDWIDQGARGDFDGQPQSDVLFRAGFEGARLP